MNIRITKLSGELFSDGSVEAEHNVIRVHFNEGRSLFSVREGGCYIRQPLVTVFGLKGISRKLN